jgi:S1-C subfamily serine protease
MEMKSTSHRNRTALVVIALLVVMAVLAACGSAIPNPFAALGIGGQDAAQEVQPQTAQAPLVSVAYNNPGLASTAAAADGSLQDNLINLYKQANPAVVYILAGPYASGTGFVYDNDGHIVTNNHVVEGADSFEVVFAGGDRSAARLVGTDADADLAVLLVDALPQGVAALPLAQPDQIAVGQFVIAIGNPFGEQGSMSFGIVSGLGRSLPSQRAQDGTGSTYTLPAVIQTDAPINPGNSGGPLLNLAGEVVGVNAAIASSTGANSGVGFAIPVAAVRQVVPSLISGGDYVYPYIGAGFDEEISLADKATYNVNQTQGAYVISVSSNSPAAQAGLQAADPNSGAGGDLIVALDGQPIRNFQDLNRYLVFGTQAGQTIQVTVLRNGQTTTLPLTLGERP